MSLLTCAPNRTSTESPDVKTYSPLECQLQECERWRVISIVALRQSENANDKFVRVLTFISQVVVHSNEQSESVLITPSYIDGPECRITPLLADGVTQVPDVELPQVIVKNEADSENVMIELFNYTTRCNRRKPSPGGTVIYILSDLSCSQLCTDTFLQSQKSILQSFHNDEKAIIVMMFVGDNGTNYDCFKTVYPECSQMPNADCMYKYVNSSGTAQRLSQQLDPFPPKPTGNPALWIGLSSAIAVLILLGIIIVYCMIRYRKTKSMQKVLFLDRFKTGKGRFAGTRYNRNTTRPPVRENDYGIVKDEWEVDMKNLTILDDKKLGSGAFCDVFQARLEGEIPLAEKIGSHIRLCVKQDLRGKHKVAVKRLPQHATMDDRLDFLNEIKFMKNLGYHPHILALLGSVTIVSDPLIIFEHCEIGDLLTYVRAMKTEDEEDAPVEERIELQRNKDLLSISWQVADGMTYLASRNFIHRDIAARNILLTAGKSAKIGDFGLCRLVDSSLYTAKGGRLPIKWMALESLKYYEYSLKSDVWSFGVLLFEVFSYGHAPYRTVQPNEMLKHLEDGNRLPQPQGCSDQIYDIMKKCWERKAENRPDINAIRDELSIILNSGSVDYGYLEAGPPSIDRQISDIDLYETTHV